MISSPSVQSRTSIDLNQPFVVFGAGHLGQKIAAFLRGYGNPPVAFCDNNAKLWGTRISGIAVHSPVDAAQRFPEATFVISIWHPTKTDSIQRKTEHLQSLGCAKVTSFIPFVNAAPESIMPNLFLSPASYLETQRDAVQAARELFDDRGKLEFDRQLQFRMGDTLALAEADSGAQYFAPEVVRLSNSECFVDCGAYDGDTLTDFLSHCKGQFRRYIALEPEPQNRTAMETALSAAPWKAKVDVLPYAVGKRQETLRFSAAGTGSSFSEDGELVVECKRLDDLLAGENPTFIKMDIEGAEQDAIEGGAETIRRARPRMAVCLYHRPEDLWTIPLQLSRLLPDSTFTLRMYCMDGFETVCYCVPNEYLR